MGYSRCATCKYFSRSTENKAIGLCAKRGSEKWLANGRACLEYEKKKKQKVNNQSRPGLTTLPGTQTKISGIWKIN